MNDSLFRAKRLDKGVWVDGYYVSLYDDAGRRSHRIYTGYAVSEPGEADNREFYPEWFEVDPATVGRFSGVFDKRGMKIFEGDIIRCDHQSLVCVVKSCSFLRDYKPGPALIESQYEVIGNIFDNRELLGGGGNE